MKINRFVALAVIALLVGGTMGAVTYRAYAHGTSAPAAQSQDCSRDQADGTELQSAGPDTDNVELQCGDQSGVDTAETIVAADTDNVNVEEQVGDQSVVDTAETIVAADTDNVNVEEQVGDQNAADTEDGAEVVSPDTDNVEEQVGDQNTPDTGEETEIAGEQDAAPTGTPAITAEAAQQTAEAYLNAGTATQVELDDEDGVLVYSVEFANGTDVKVDAMTGAVLGVETGQD